MSISDWFLRIFSLGRGIISLIFSIVLCAVLISLKPQEQQNFHDVMISTFLYPAQAILSRIDRTIRVYKENDELKIKNTSLRLENDYLLQAIKALPRVEQMDAFGARSGLKLKMAQISADDPSRYSTNWVINLGKDDSIEVNMPVMTALGIVGKTAKCYGSHSLVQGLSDPNSKVSVLCNRSRMNGVLEAWPGGKLLVRFPADAEVKLGDTLVTSGMGGVFPKGLLVGIIGEPHHDASEGADILKALEVKPFQNPYLVEEVFVLLRKDSWTVGSEK